MSADDFWMIWEEALERAEDKLVFFAVAPNGVTAWAWDVEDWSPARSSAVEDMERAYYHVLAMEHVHVC